MEQIQCRRIRGTEKSFPEAPLSTSQSDHMPPRSWHWSATSNARLSGCEAQTFQITHPFHPLHGKTYSLVTYKHDWGLDRIYYHDETGRLRSVPARWTNVFDEDPFVAISAGAPLSESSIFWNWHVWLKGFPAVLHAKAKKKGMKKCKVNYA